MESRHLETFERVVALGSQAAAARAMGISPPTVTLRLHELERSLSGSLFGNAGGVRRLTPLGEETLRCARDVAASLNRLHAVAAVCDDELVGSIALGCVEPAASTWLPVHVGQLYRARPGIRLQIVGGSTSGMLSKVRSGELMAAITTRIASSGVSFHRLFSEQLGVAVPSGHRLIQHTTVTMDDLRGELLLVAEATCVYREMFTQSAGRGGIEPVISAEISSPAALGAVAQELGRLAIGPLSGFTHSTMAVRPLAGAEVEIGIITKPGGTINPLINELVTFLRAATTRPTVA
jgi:DNA-binding transcriptional LysR family regulator